MEGVIFFCLQNQRIIFYTQFSLMSVLALLKSCNFADTSFAKNSDDMYILTLQFCEVAKKTGIP